MIKESILELVGNTPLVELKRIEKPKGARFFAKLESYNPSGSLKDRIVRFIIEKAEGEGRLEKGDTVFEASSGNTGISMGMICSIKGYKARVYIPANKTPERMKIMDTWGVEVIKTSTDDQNSHIWAALELVEEKRPGHFYLDQNGNPGNWMAHYEGTGGEILEQTGGKIDFFIAGFGTGGVLVGAGKRLKEENRGTKIVALEPARSKSKIEGLLHMDGTYVPPIHEPEVMDEWLRIDDEEAVSCMREIQLIEGISVGVSSGAVLSAAKKVAEREKGGDFVLLFGDRGDRYMSIL